MRKLDTSLGAVQWFAFLLANSLAFPIIIGQAYHLSAVEIAGMLQRTFFVVGLGSLLTGLFGHRLPILDGPAGVWISIFVVMGEMALQTGHQAGPTLQLLEGGMSVSGFILVLLSAAGLMKYILKLFTPLVTGISLILLGIQLSGTLLNGMIGVNADTSHIHKWNVLISFSVFILVFALSTWGKGWLKSYAVLIGMMFGWLAFVLVNGPGTAMHFNSVFSFPKPFAWGLPHLNSGMIVSSIVISFVLICNVVTSVFAMMQVFAEREKNKKIEGTHTLDNKGNLNRSTFMNGVSNILSAVFSTAGVVPVSISASFVRMTGQYKIKPFIIACAAIIIASCLPVIYTWLSTLPGQIAYAALLTTFTQLIGIGISAVLREPLDSRRLTIFGIALSLGTSVMFLPEELTAHLPTMVQYIISNGLMVGTLITLILEQIWKPQKSKVKKGMSI